MKFNIGKEALAKYDITLEQRVMDIDEIQGEDPEIIVRDKAARAFKAVKSPVIVTDDSWAIPGLRGFPGPYMKSVNHWFTPDDFMRLTRDLEDRSVFINQFVAYHDEYEIVIFRYDVPGTLLTEPRGVHGPSITKVVSLDADSGLSIAEAYDQGKTRDITGNEDAWHQLAEWYMKKTKV